MVGFADRYKALLLMAQLIGILERKIKRGLEEASDAGLFSLERKLLYRVRETAKPENLRAVSLGRLKDAWYSHPFYKLLENERQRRLTHNREGISLMSDRDIKEYLIRKSDRHQSYSPKELPVLRKASG